jgi:hypothetical protein
MFSHPRHTIVFRRGLAVLFGLLGANCWHVAGACDTPVYRYAMYRWEPAPYEVFCFHREPLADGPAGVREAILAAQRSDKQPANIGFVPVDLSKDAELKGVHKLVREAWQAKPDRPTPGYLVFSPVGQEVWGGDLEQTAIPAMLTSPAREAIARQLGEGKVGVLVLVTSADAAANAEAERTIQEVFHDIANGKVPLYAGPPVGDGEKPGDGPKLEFGLVQVARNDVRERWLVEQLLAMESDLRDQKYATAPMAFPVFGRGRALPPCLGKGINRENLLAVADFITGACSCTVKDQNPGVDLLMACDWNAVAEELAEKFGAEEGNESMVGTAGLFPQLMIPAASVAASDPPRTRIDDEPAKDAPAPPHDARKSADGEAARPAGSAVEVPESQPAKPAEISNLNPDRNPELKPTAPPATEEPADKSAAPATGDAHGDEDRASGDARPSAEGGALTSVFTVGAGVALALIVLFVLTFVVLRPR